MVKTDSNTALFIKWIVDAFENCSQKTAIIDHAGERETTYEELYIMACRVVGYIDKRRLPAHSFIGICLPTSMEYIAAEIGIWLAGHAIIPMGDQFPESRIQQIMEHSESPLLIDEKVMSEMASTEPKEPSALPGEDDINALFYTSGSTGQPKGVLHSFRSFGIPLFPDKMFQDLDVSVMAVTAPMFFVACKLIYDFITRGKTVNVVPQNIRMDIRKLEDFLAEQRIEFVFIPPSVLPYFQNKSQALKVVFTASERVSGVGPKGYKLVNYCGQTETAGIGCTFMIDKPYDNTPIGIPVEPYIYSVQDEDGNEVPFGEEGELCYRGDLTPGYYKDPERTAQLYRGGWLHTGDIVRARPDGNLIYVNRKDWMVKINGQRVEPSEVETVFKKIPGIDNAIVKGFTSGNKRQYLCGYYISKTGVTEQEIIDYLTSKLPAYMVPVYFVKMESFPLNMNGKTDRKSLQSPAVEDDVIERAPYEAPQNDTEAKLCTAFERTLGHTQVGVNEDFFLMGGDSIRVMKLQTLCADLSIDARMIYTHRTPRRIAEAISKKGEFSFERLADYPLSQTQLGIFAACMARQGEVVYNNSTLFKLAPGLDLPRLAKALEAVVEAHPFVKTRLFINSNGNPRQRRNDDESYRQEIEQMSDADFELIRPHLVQPFFLLDDPLFRIHLYSTPSAAYLFLDFHHIIFDGYSFEVLLDELNAAYAGKSLQQEAWSGFEIAQEEEMLRKTDAYQQAAKWNKEQFGDLEVVSLPEGDRREEDVAYAKEELLLDIPYQELEDACDKLGVTPNVLTTVAFGYLLGVYSHAQESLFATIYNGRKDLKTVGTIGMLVKTLPVYIKWQEQLTVRELLHTVRQQLVDSMGYDLYSFNELNALNSHVNSRILFAWQGDLVSTHQIGGRSYKQIPVMENATGEQLVMQLFRQDKGLRLNTEYQANVYSQVFIVRMMQCYRQILHGFIKASVDDRPLAALPLIASGDQTALIALGTGSHLNYDTTQTFTSLFVKQASRTPDAIAVVDKKGSITYAELNRQSDILAAILQKAHVTTDTFVGVMLPRRISFMVAVLAVFKAGGAYIPLDFDYPYSRLKYMLDDSQARILVTTKAILEKKKTDGDFPVETVILIDDIDFSVESTPINNSRPSSLCYMIYTSGSTGLPKGVMVEHRGLLNFLEWLLKEEQLKAGEQCAVHTSFSFDGSVFDLFPPLMCGATLHILSGGDRQDLNVIYDYLVENKIVGMLLTTQLGMALQMQYDLPLRFLMLGGEKLTNFKPSNVQLFNCYGPTEFTVCSSYYLIDQYRTYDNIPIGRPAPNSISAVVDQAGRLVPRGVVGELCLLGRQLTRGYWMRPELTAEKFVACPFVPDSLMYRTGDLVRWNEENQLEYMGRIDSQTKLRGFRIELGEIENKICEYPDISDAAVVIQTSGKAEFLVGFYCAAHPVSPELLRQALEKQLPDYMIPQQLRQLESLPLSPNGKVDRKALTTLDTFAAGRPEVVNPRNPREQFILDLTRELLGTDHLGVTDDLTMQGLNSLAAINLVSMANLKGEELKVNDVLRLKTIEKIAAHQTTIGDWAQGYDVSKPVAVVVQGLTSYRLLQPLITMLCHQYSVFVVEPLQEHYLKSFRGKSKTDIVNAYTEVIRQSLPENTPVSLFAGHSYGGELSYRCAAKWHSETGQTPRIMLLDSYFDALKVVEKMRHMQEYVVPIEDGAPMPGYDGIVDYFEATQMAFKEMRDMSIMAWKQLLPHIHIYPIATSHFKLLEKQNINKCLSIIRL